jgi:hypothetical protein
MNSNLITRKIELRYPNGRWIIVRRSPTDYEIKKRKFSRHKMIDRSELVLNNELEIKIYNVSKVDFVTVISGGNWDFKETIPSGTVIDIKVKYADDELKKDINSLARELCKLHLRPCVCYPGVYLTRAKIDYFLHTEEEGTLFADSFISGIKRRVQMYDTGRKLDEPLSEEEKDEIEREAEKLKELDTEIKAIDEGEEQMVKPLENQEINVKWINKCSFCSRTTDNLIACKYCLSSFCEEHSEPRTPHDFLRTKGGHSCKQFFEQEKEKQSKDQVPVNANIPTEKKSFWKRLRGK